MPKEIQKILAFDFGLRQIGIASGSKISGMTSELATISAKDGKPDWNELSALVQEWKPDLCLVGLPLNMDDSESESSQRARKFANQIHGRLGVMVEMIDERLTSFEAKEMAREMGHNGDYKKAPIDSLAAKLLAEQWLHQNS